MESEERPPSPSARSCPTHLASPVLGIPVAWLGNEEHKSIFVPDCRACVESPALGWVNAEIVRLRRDPLAVIGRATQFTRDCNAVDRGHDLPCSVPCPAERL